MYTKEMKRTAILSVRDTIICVLYSKWGFVFIQTVCIIKAVYTKSEINKNVYLFLYSMIKDMHDNSKIWTSA